MKSKEKKSTAVIIDCIEKATRISINKPLQFMFTVVMEVTYPITGAKYRVKKKY